MPKHEEIKAMKLYHHVDRIERRLLELGYSDKRQLVDVERLATKDSLHFYGDEPVVSVLELLRSGRKAEKDSLENATVLDIGSGYGSAARLLAHRSSCHVDALELQPDMSAAGEELTRRCALQHKVTHHTGDFLAWQQPEKTALPKYDAVVGLLCFMHIDDWPELFRRCFERLAPGGFVYMEDFFLRQPGISAEETRLLREDVFCPTLRSRQQIEPLLKSAGFASVEFQDRSAKWEPYVTQRALDFQANLNQHIAIDGEKVAQSLNHFYGSVARLFQGDHVGGFTLVARKAPAANHA